jgi:hypothetical protein
MKHSALHYSALAIFCLGVLQGSGTSLAQQTPAPQAKSDASSQLPADAGVPTGKKLVLKDGTFQVIREYQRNGDRVHYYSLERGEWDDIPASMIDWPATEKANAATTAADAALLQRVHKHEAEALTELSADVDASLPVAPGVFLPGQIGMFAVDHKSVIPIPQVESEMKLDKKRFLEQVLTPVPIVPGKRNVVLPGAHAKLRLASGNPEFYLREAPEDADNPDAPGSGPIQRRSRTGERPPEVVLIRTPIKGNKRELESISNLFGQQLGTRVDSISMQRWDVAPLVHRFTLGEPLKPGEYALAQMLPGGINLYVWEFGVDEPGKEPLH